MNRSCKENPAVSNQSLANQPGPGEKLFNPAVPSTCCRNATYAPPQRRAVHRDHRSQRYEESSQALLSLDASTSPLSPEHQFKIKARLNYDTGETQ